MSLAPTAQLHACLGVIRHAILDARVSGWSNKIQPDRLADLMDAIHNLPALLLDWERCDQKWLRSSLESYDRKWPGQGTGLLHLYDRILKEQEG